MIIMLVGEFDFWRIVLQLGFQSVICFVRDYDGLQGFVIIKRTVANVGHGVGDGEGLQWLATHERIVANARHEIWNGDEL